MNMNDENMIKRDRMRFIKNSQSANLCYLAILLNVFYFVSIYKSDVGSYYYNILIGVSIVYNLIFMLAVFLSSEEVKNYNIKYSYLLNSGRHSADLQDLYHPYARTRRQDRCKRRRGACNAQRPVYKSMHLSCCIRGIPSARCIYQHQKVQ